MSIAALAALVLRLLLATVFAVAGVAKLANFQRSKQTLSDFGLPAWSVPVLGTLLPLVELAVAGTLLFPSTLAWGLPGAALLLLTFTAAIGINLALGRRPDCNCFGQVHSEPIGAPTLARNGLLLLAVALVGWQARSAPPLSLFSHATMTATNTTLIVLALAQFATLLTGAWLASQFLRQNGRLLLRIDDLQAQLDRADLALPTPAPKQPDNQLPVGSPAPPFALPDLHSGATTTLDSLRALNRPTLLVFSDPDCGPCSALLPDLARWQSEDVRKLTLVIVSRGTARANLAKLGNHALTRVLLQSDREVAAAYQIPGTPGAILIDSQGRIASRPAMGAQAIAALVAQTRSQATAAGLDIGTPAPSVFLPSLRGEPVSLADYRGREVLLLFWNPTCGFCNRMLPELRALEADCGATGPQLILVSGGTPEAHSELALQCPVLLDASFATGRAFQVRGTPSAVLVDAHGTIASELAVGSTQILALANTRLELAERDHHQATLR